MPEALTANLADLMLSADRVEAGELDPKAASTAASIRQWLASRYVRATFGDQSKVDMNVRGNMVGLYVAAVRVLAQREISDQV